MKKEKLLAMALLGISSAAMLTGCQKTDTRKDQRERPSGNTSAAEQQAPVAINQSCGGGCGGQQQPVRGQQTQGGYYDASQGQRQYYNNQMYQGQPQQGYQQPGYQQQGYQGQQYYQQ